MNDKDVYLDVPTRMGMYRWWFESTRNDYNLSPSRYVSVDEGEPVLPLEEAITLLRTAEADEKQHQVLQELRLER